MKSFLVNKLADLNAAYRKETGLQFRMFRYLARLTKDLTAIQKSYHANIFHCCTQKTASQWFRLIFSDPVVYQHTGLNCFSFESFMDLLVGKYPENADQKWDRLPTLLYRDFCPAVSVPVNTIITPLYIGRNVFGKLPKPENHKAFFVMRDPRDIVVSWYFSIRDSHPLMGNILKHRKILQKTDFKGGLKYTIDVLQERGVFEAQRSWMIQEPTENVKVFRFEDLTNNSLIFLERLFEFLQVEIQGNDVKALDKRYHFKKLSRSKPEMKYSGKTDHYRKGISGDWKNHFDGDVKDYFDQVSGELIEILGYSSV